MPLIPAQVPGVVFGKPPIGKQGYDQDQVDAFLDVVEAELTRLLAENTDLSTQLAQCDQQSPPQARDTAATWLQPGFPPIQQPPAGEHDYHHNAARVLSLAQQTADRMTSQAQAEADTLLSQARAHAEQLLRQAQSTAQGLVTEATTQAETVLRDAQTRADSVERQSRDKLDKLVSQQQEQLRQHTEIITALGADKAALDNWIKHLRIFDDDHRARMMRFVRAQLDQLGTPPTRRTPTPDQYPPSPHGRRV